MVRSFIHSLTLSLIHLFYSLLPTVCLSVQSYFPKEKLQFLKNDSDVPAFKDVEMK